MPFSFRQIGVRGLSGLTLVALGAMLMWSADVLDRPAKYIHVRWRADVTADVRAGLETRFSLARQQDLEGQSFGYDLLDDSTSNIRALVTHPTVEDTHDLDRDLFTVAPTAEDGDSRIGLAPRWGVEQLVPFVTLYGAVLVAVGTALLMSRQRLASALEWGRTLLRWIDLRGVVSLFGLLPRPSPAVPAAVRTALLASQRRLARGRMLLQNDLRRIASLFGVLARPSPVVLAVLAVPVAPILVLRSIERLFGLLPRPSPAVLAVLALVAVRVLGGWNATADGADIWVPWLETPPTPIDHLVTGALLATGALLTFQLAARQCGAPSLALAITLVMLWIFPGRGSEVGFLLYAMVVWACNRYIDRSGREGFWLLTLLTVAVAACRVDHGLYVAVATVAALAVRHVPDRARTFGRTTLEYAGSLAVVTLLFLPLGQVPALLDRLADGIAGVVAARVQLPASSDAERRSGTPGDVARIVEETSGIDRNTARREVSDSTLSSRASALTFASGLRWMWVILPVAAAIRLGYHARRRMTGRPDSPDAMIVLPALLLCMPIGWLVVQGVADTVPVAAPALPALAVVTAWLFTGLAQRRPETAGAPTRSWVDTPIPRWATPYRARDVYITVGLVLLTVFLHLHVNAGVTNDHAGYLSMARQIVYGDWPIRDFRDDGSLLQILLSAAVQKLGGFHLLGENLLSWTFFAAANCVTFWLAFRLSGSRATAVVAAVLAALLIPRPYAYPKLFIYPLAILALWRYVDRPQTARLAVVAATTALAFLFRIDHGVVIAATSVVAVAVVHAMRPHTMVAHGLLLGAWFMVLALPQMAYITWSVGVRRYLESILTFGTYADASREPFPFALSLNSGLVTEMNAVTFLLDLSVVIVGTALVYAVIHAGRAWSQRKDVPRETLQVLLVAVMWLLMIPMLARGQYYTRVAEIGQPVAILGAWLWVVSAGVVPGRFLRVAAGAVLLVVTVWALSLREPLVYFFTTPGQVLAGAPFQSERLKDWATSAPIDEFAPDEVEGERWMIRYAHICTRPTDRLLVTWFAPEVYFFAGRAFAGDRWVYLAFDNSPERQRLVTDRIRAQSVPIVFVDMAQYAVFRKGWPAVAAYLEDEYVVAADVTIDPNRTTRVLARKNVNPSRHLSFANLPCFT